jgi:ABC-type sugar transport system substrate-binding protein
VITLRAKINAMADRAVAVFLRTLENDYQKHLRDECLAAARSRAFSIDVFAANDDAETQVRQIRDFLASKSRGKQSTVMVSPVRESALLGTAFDAARMGVGWVVLNRTSDYVAQLRSKFPKIPLFCVTHDQREIGRIQARQLAVLLPNGGEVLCIRGPLSTTAAQKRFEGLRELLEGGSIHLLPFNSDWSTEGGERITHEWLHAFGRGPIPKCVVCAQNDHMAAGARRALTQAAGEQNRSELAKIPVIGCDGSPGFGQRLVIEGHLTATVITPLTGRRAIEEVAAMLDGRPPPPEVLLEVTSYPSLEHLSRARSRPPLGS